MKGELIRRGTFDGKEYYGDVIETDQGTFLAAIHEVAQLGFGELPAVQIFNNRDEAVKFVETEWEKRFNK